MPLICQVDVQTAQLLATHHCIRHFAALWHVTKHPAEILLGTVCIIVDEFTGRWVPNRQNQFLRLHLEG